jgi:hypothetical protein
MNTYSKDLVQRLQLEFKEKYDEDVDDDTAQIYLESFATLFLAFRK